MVIPPKEIDKALARAEPLFSKLQTLYQRLPDTRCRCDQAGRCCVYIPEMTWLEALQWFAEIKSRPREEKTGLVREFVSFYLTNPVRAAHCPFLNNGSCGSYQRRTFACRAYGIWSPKTGRRRTRENRRNQQKLLKAWKKFGVYLPHEALASEMEYCNHVEVCAAGRPPDTEIFGLLEQVYSLDAELADPGKWFETVCHSDFSFLIASLVLGSRKAVLGKFAVVKEIVQKGTDTRLTRFLGNITEGGSPI